jgi:hypothetical protein
MTRLQEFWDQRNHPVYEWSREGRALPPDFTLTDVALAEALYLIDDQASRNWRTFLHHCHRTSRRGRSL